MELQFELNKPLEHVYGYLVDMQKFVSVHPVIYRMDSLGDNKYKVYEKLKFGFIPYSFTYPVTVMGVTETNTVNMRARVMGMVNIDIVISLREQDGVTRVQDAITFKTIWPVKSLMAGIFRTQHRQLFLNIGQRG